MKPADIESFGKLWAANVEALGGTRPSRDAVTIVFGDLAGYELDEIRDALAEHRRRSEFIPRVKLVVALIEGVVPAPAELVAVGQAMRHPLALAVRAILGVDLTAGHPRDLAARVAASIDRVTEFHGRATRGEYTEEEIARMLAAGIDPAGPIGPDMPPPRARFRAELARRVALVRERQALPAARTHRELTRDERDASDAVRREVLGALGIRPRPKDCAPAEAEAAR